MGRPRDGVRMFSGWYETAVVWLDGLCSSRPLRRCDNPRICNPAIRNPAYHHRLACISRGEPG
eukprot:12046495-Alexandrium_andersonii.AAC.1